MGAGKSTVGRLVARRLGWDFVDLDEEVATETGRSVPALFAAGGEPAFREAEARCLAAILADEARGPVVVAAGGGVVGDPANRGRLQRAGTVVWLRAEVATLEARVGDGSGRPLLAGADDAGRRSAIGALAARRAPLYEEVADAVVDVDGLPAAEVAARVEAAVRPGG